MPGPSAPRLLKAPGPNPQIGGGEPVRRRPWPAPPLRPGTVAHAASKESDIVCATAPGSVRAGLADPQGSELSEPCVRVDAPPTPLVMLLMPLMLAVPFLDSSCQTTRSSIYFASHHLPTRTVFFRTVRQMSCSSTTSRRARSIFARYPSRDCTPTKHTNRTVFSRAARTKERTNGLQKK